MNFYNHLLFLLLSNYVTSSHATLAAMTMELRGGNQRGIFGIFQGFPLVKGLKERKSYAHQLEDRLSSLQQQIRLSREEVRQLRSAIQVQKSVARKAGGEKVKELKGQIGLLNDQLKSLRKQVAELLKNELELRKLLEQEELKVGEVSKEMQAKLDKAMERSKEIERNKDKLIADCRTEISDLKEKLLDIEKSCEERLKKEQRKSEKLLEEEEREFDKALKDLQIKLTKESEEEIKRVREEAEIAVDLEKTKLRKLVKAFGERENRTISQKDRTVASSSSKTQSASNVATVRAKNP